MDNILKYNLVIGLLFKLSILLCTRWIALSYTTSTDHTLHYPLLWLDRDRRHH